MPGGRRAPGRTGWWRKYFLDHPLKDEKHPTAYVNPSAQSSEKFKALCRACYNHLLAEAKKNDPHINERAFSDQRKSSLYAAPAGVGQHVEIER